MRWSTQHTLQLQRGVFGNLLGAQHDLVDGVHRAAHAAGQLTLRDAALLNQFEQGLKADAPLGVTTEKPAPGSNKVKAVTGATISSRAVSTIVNEALTPQLRAALVKALQAGPKLRPKAKE